MTMQPFKIQSPTLSLNGVNIDTSAQGKLVIPGVTRAGTSVAIEVNDTGDQTTAYPQLNGDTTLLTIIDGYQFAVLNGDVVSPIVGWTAATYAADALDGEGYIDGISVVTGGAGYTGEAVTYSQRMLATTYSDPINNFNPGDWDWIPFAVRCGAGEIASEFGGGTGSGLVQRSVNYPTGASGDTAGTMALDANNGNNVYVCTADWVDAVQTFEVDTGEDYLAGQTGGDIQFIIPQSVYTNLANIVNNASDWTITCELADAVGTFAVNNIGTWSFTSGDFNGQQGWAFNVGTLGINYPTINESVPAGTTITLNYTGAQPAIWTQSNLGDLFASGQLISNRPDFIGGESTIGFFNNNLDMFVQSNQDHSFAEVWMRNNDTSAPHVDINVRAAAPSWGSEGVQTWSFDAQGGLTFPNNTVQTTAYTGAGGGGAPIGYMLTLGDIANLTTNLRVSVTDGSGSTYYFGDTTGNTPGDSPIVIKVDSTGAVLWQTTVWIPGTVTSAYVFGSYVQFTALAGDSKLYTVSLNGGDGTQNNTAFYYSFNSDTVIARDMVIGSVNGTPAYDVSAGYVQTENGPKRGLVIGSGIGGPLAFQVTDDESSDVEYFGITDSQDGKIYAVGQSQFYSSLVTSGNLDGSANWHKQINLGFNWIVATSVAYSNGYIYVTSNDWNMGSAGFVTKMDVTTGAVVWSRGMGNTFNNEPFGIADGAVVVDGNGDIIVAWNYGSAFSQNADLLIVKFDSDGNCLWQRSIETANNDSTDKNQSTEILSADSTHYYLAMTASTMGTSIGGAIKLPLDGSGTGAYGVWTYRAQTWSVTNISGSSEDVTSHFTVAPYTYSTTNNAVDAQQNGPIATSIEIIYGTGNSSSLFNNNYSVILDSHGNLNLPDHSYTLTGAIRSLNGYPTLTAYGSDGHGGPELDWMDTDSPQTDSQLNTTLRHAAFLNDESGFYIGMNENQKPGTFSGNWVFNTAGSLFLPEESIVGSFVNDTSNGSYNEWFVASVAGPDGTVYAVGGESNTGDYYIMAQTSNATLWRKALDSNQDFGDGTGGHQPQGMNIKFDSAHNLLYVGFDSGNSTGVISMNPANGVIDNAWVIRGGTDGVQTVSQKSFEINSNGDPIIVGHSFGGYLSFAHIAGTNGTDNIGNDYIQVALGDIGSPTEMARWNGSKWQIDVSGNGNWFEPNDFDKWDALPVTFTGGPGRGVQTATEGSAYSTSGLTGSNSRGIDLDVNQWTDSAMMNLLLTYTSGTTFTIVIGSLTPGVAQTVLTFSSISDWSNTGAGIFHMDGNYTVVSGTGNMDTAATDIMSLAFGITMLVDLGVSIGNNWGPGYRDLSDCNIRTVGTGYVDGDTVVVKGSLLGGVDGGYILSATTSGSLDNAIFFDNTTYPTLDVQLPAGTLFRYNGVNGLNQTVVSVADRGDGNWIVTVTGAQVYNDGVTIDFFAGNDAILTYRVNQWQSYADIVACLPSETVRFPMSQTVTTQSTYNVRRQEGQQAFVWTTSWSHTYGTTTYDEEFRDVAYDPVNNTVFLVGQFSQNNVAPSQLVMALSAANGSTLWQKYVGDNNVGNYGDSGSIDVDPSGNVITVGENDNGQAMITKLNGVNGSAIWQTVQTNQSNWNNQPLGKVDSNGDVYFGGTYYNYDVNHEILNLIKLNGNNGTLAWASNVDNAEGRYLYEMYDTFQQTINVEGGQVQWAGFVYDINNDWYDGVSISLPQNGTGIGSYGRWIVTQDTNIALIVNNDSYVINSPVPYVATDNLTFTLTNPAIRFYDASGSTITRNNISLGGGKIVFPDGSNINQAGISRALKDTGDSNIVLDYTHNGKFLYFGSNTGAGNSTVVVPQNSVAQLPIGYTVTLVIDDFDGYAVFVNTNGDTSSGLHINAVGYSQSMSNSNWWIIGIDSQVGIYSLMKVDTNRWILSGPAIGDDS